jgi:hypothetical protein
VLRPSPAIAAAALALCAAGCGGGSGSSSSTGSAAPPAASTPAPAQAKSIGKALQTRGNALQACYRQASGDPHKLAACLGGKRLISAGLAQCLQGATSSGDVESCIRKAGGQ